MSDSNARNFFPMSREKFTRTLGWLLTSAERAELLNTPKVYFCNLNNNRKKGFRERFDAKYKLNTGLYYYISGEHIQFRYEMGAVMHENQHSIYFHAIDHKEGKHVLIKNIRKRSGLPWNGIEREFCYLKKFTKDPLKNNVVNVISSFYYRYNYFIVMEKMRWNLTNLVSVNTSSCAPNFANRIAYALFFSLNKVHGQKLIHCNLSPTKIFVTDIRLPLLKIGGFGLCCSFMEAMGHRIDELSFNKYQAPEIILVGDISVATDVWSLGCMIFELYTGVTAFNGEDAEDMVVLMIERLGLPPASFLETCNPLKVRNLLDAEGNPRYCIRVNSGNDFSMLIPTPSRSGRIRTLPGASPLIDLIGDGDSYIEDFITKCLMWCPEERITVEDALKHPYIKRAASSQSK